MKTLAITLLLAGLGTTALAQPAPFDMTPERTDGRTAPPAAGAQQPPAGDARPQAQTNRRYLLQAPKLRLQGEEPVQGWSFMLTPEQAAAETTLDIGYRNSVVIAPEASRLSVFINDVPVISQPPRGTEFDQRLTVALPAGVLRPGPNHIRFQADQRHRTDCTVDSTYSLWTEFDAAGTFLTFASPDVNRMIRLEDIRAMSVDPEGRSRFLLVAPSLGQPAATSGLLKLAQGLSLLSGAANLSFSVSQTLPEAVQPGEIVVIVATPEEMDRLAGPASPAQRSRMMAGFEPLPGVADASALVFLGPDWSAIGTIVDNFLTVSANAGAEPGRLGSAASASADTPMVEGASTLSFDTLGIASQEFSGRRFSREFTIGIPADFYANAYGTATILLDAAYSSQVLPGSSINVIVNGNLATTVPITARGGAVLRHDPIRVTMRHFRSGVNTIRLEATLVTREDLACAPGATADRTARFAIFNTSELVIPDFARLTLAPDLSATAGLGVPYQAPDRPTAVVLARNDETTLAAATTVLGKLALAAGHSLPVELSLTTEGIAAGSNALIFGTTGDLPAETFSNVDISAVHPNGGAGPETGNVNVDSWRNMVDSGPVVELLSDVNLWLKDTFNLDLTAFNFWSRDGGPYRLPESTGIFVDQTVDRASKTIRTIVSAANAELLETGTAAIGDRQNWLAIEGRTSYLDTRQTTFSSVPATDQAILSLQPRNFTNLRLVLTNWLSGNYAAYALAFVFSSVALGLSTHLLLRRLGRGEHR
ncbi:cellulose biosynthesis cyclic di-GMP-binding regulatory protein BcsB [Rhizobiaceae bacterium BDR2-2]|uniref:Cyclic di-GMP-binding protein n=1 Tax=Ectorhizobium quercum TaxID=2965071 RepID=A0AAE3N111_9HYPH|nr:cellulose biosynthesis cyclic di-GMP-binding regulatory protein BcsB [Ectorhizobium quercum]MCX8997921.1 cellulose biosynthesis cyclic di-GMP-binding regulatory protein BcsB [Ectorhizobium quercum]